MAMQPLRLVKFEALYEVLINEICGIMKINFEGDGSSVYGGFSVWQAWNICNRCKGLFHVRSAFMHDDLFKEWEK